MRSIAIHLAGVAVLFALGCSQEQTTSSTTTTAATQPTSKDRESAITELNDATKMLGELNVPSLVPKERLEKAQCAVVAPSLMKGAFLVGAQHGNGVVSCRTREGWSGPIFITMTGGSGGVQAGFQSSDVLMLVQTQRGMAKLFTNGFKMGGDMSIAAGPVGKEKTAGTDPSMNADIITYARSKGLFAGVDLSGVSISHDEGKIAALYGNQADVHAILDGRIRAPREARPFLDELKSVFPAAANPTLAERE